jgi:methyl-accepting chemotaxis protein
MLHKLIVLILVSGSLAIAGCDRGQQDVGTTAPQAKKSVEMAQPAMPEMDDHSGHTMEDMASSTEGMGEDTMEEAAETMADAAEAMDDTAAEVSEMAGEMEKEVEKKVNEGIEAVKPVLEQ